MELSYIFLMFRYITVIIILKIKILVIINFLYRGCLSSIDSLTILMNFLVYKWRVISLVHCLKTIISIRFLHFLWIIFCVSLFIFIEIRDLIVVFRAYKIIFHYILRIILRFRKDVCFNHISWTFEMMNRVSRILDSSLNVVCSFAHFI